MLSPDSNMKLSIPIENTCLAVTAVERARNGCTYCYLDVMTDSFGRSRQASEQLSVKDATPPEAVSPNIHQMFNRPHGSGELPSGASSFSSFSVRFHLIVPRPYQPGVSGQSA